MAEPFTRAGKAILLCPGSELMARVDAWLVPPVNRGQIAGRLERVGRREVGRTFGLRGHAGRESAGRVTSGRGDFTNGCVFEIVSGEGSAQTIAGLPI